MCVEKFEKGYARAVKNQSLAEENRELMFPQSAYTFGKMFREDSKVKSVFRAVTLPIRRANWELDPNGAPDEIVAHVADDLRLQVRGESGSQPVAPRRGRVSWEHHLEQLLLALVFGHMFFEQIYTPGADGREHLVKLAPRWPGTIDRINVAADGGLESIEQRALVSGKSKWGRTVIPINRLVAYVFDDVGSQWVGTSLFRPSYKHWKLKDELLRKELITLDRNGMGVPIYTGSEFAADQEADVTRGQELANDLRSGDYAGASIPFGAKLELKGVQGQLVSPREAIIYHDAQIAIAALANFLNLEGGGGSYALASTQSDFFNQSEQTTAGWVQDVVNQHVIEDLVRVAFPDYSGSCPMITFDAIGSRKELSAQDLATLVRDKVIFADKDLDEHTRRIYDLPAKQKLVDALETKLERERLEQQMGVTLSSDPEPTADQIISNLIDSKIREHTRE